MNELEEFMYLRTREKCFFFSFLNFDRFGHFLGKLPKGSASFISKAANIQFRKQTWFGILKSLSTYMRLTFFPHGIFHLDVFQMMLLNYVQCFSVAIHEIAIQIKLLFFKDPFQFGYLPNDNFYKDDEFLG